MSVKPINLSELIEAFEFDSDERVTNVDLQNGCVVSVDRFLLSAVEEADEALLAELPDGQEPPPAAPTKNPPANQAKTAVVSPKSGERCAPSPREGRGENSPNEFAL